MITRNDKYTLLFDQQTKVEKVEKMSKTSFNLLGVEFAPIWIPIERRLQVNILR